MDGNIANISLSNAQILYLVFKQKIPGNNMLTRIKLNIEKQKILKNVFKQRKKKK